MIRFIDKNTLLIFHKDQLERYGGKQGLRDEGLLESALAQPQTSFDGEYVHQNIFQMAAAYGFHICQSHRFFDGNKQTALISMYMFLYVNGYKLVADKKSLFALIMDLANGEVSKEELTKYLKEHSNKRE